MRSRNATLASASASKNVVLKMMCPSCPPLACPASSSARQDSQLSMAFSVYAAAVQLTRPLSTRSPKKTVVPALNPIDRPSMFFGGLAPGLLNCAQASWGISANRRISDMRCLSIFRCRLS